LATAHQKQQLPRVHVVGKTDLGLVRPGNEDYLHLDPGHNVYAVCDGMGGHQAGEVASMTAAQTIAQAFGNYFDKLAADESLALDRTVPPGGDVLVKAIRLANRSIYHRSLEEESLSGIGTTVVAVAFEADMMSVAHVGYSRAYRLDKRELVPLTKDHSWLVEMQESQHISEEEASSFVSKNVITRALGVKDTVEVDYRLVRVKPGEIFILCSDGLCGFADNDEIFDVATRNRTDLDKMTRDLIQMANDRGGSDNVSVIAIQVLESAESELPEVEVFTVPPESDAILQAEDKWVRRFWEETNSDRVEPQQAASAPNKWVLIGLFVLFVLIAAVIIIMSQGK